MKNSYIINDNYCTLVCHSNYFGDILFIIDAEDYKRVRAFDWKVNVIRTKSGNQFRAISYGFISIYLHRLITSFSYKIVDHKNRNPQDNRKSNLRGCDNKQNSINRKSDTKKLPKGVYHARNGQFRARIWINGKNINLGCNYKSPDEALNAFKKASRRLHGEFSVY
jgi:hypothetical protein